MECYEEAIKLLSESKANASTSDSQTFGTDITYVPARVIWPDTIKLHNMSTEKTNSNTDKFTMIIHETKPSTQKKSIVSFSLSSLLILNARALCVKCLLNV